MPFSDFIGNNDAVTRLRGLIAGRQMTRAVVLAGPPGSGKTTLACMAGLAMNCLQPPQPGDFCGVCASCSQFTGFDAIDSAIESAAEFRDAEVKTRAREEAPLVVPVHPQIRIFPPDPEFLTMAQAREITRSGHLAADAGRQWTFVIPEFDRARWMTQSALLKTLEEPPEGVAILALARNPLELLPTVRSRSMVIGLAPVPDHEAEALLAVRRTGVKAADRALIARLARGCVGRALRLDLDEYREIREQALALAAAASGSARDSHSDLFQVTELWRGPRESGGKEKFESLIEILYSVLQDILYLEADLPGAIRNIDCRSELNGLGRSFTQDRLFRATEGLDRILSASRRNANRPLALDSWALTVSQPGRPS
jgi:DNA polymerase-3 subunit delta'